MSDNVKAENSNNETVKVEVVDERNWFDKMFDRHPKMVLVGATTIGAILGASAVIGLAYLCGGDANVSEVLTNNGDVSNPIA